MKKAWVSIIVSVISLLTALGVAWINKDSATKDDHEHTMNQVNDKMLPEIERQLREVSTRLARVEGKLSVVEKMIEKPGVVKPPAPLRIEPMAKIPRLEQRAY